MVPAGNVAALTSALREAFLLTGQDLERRVARARQIVIERGERRTNLLLMDELYRSLVPAGTAAAPR